MFVFRCCCFILAELAKSNYVLRFQLNTCAVSRNIFNLRRNGSCCYHHTQSNVNHHTNINRRHRDFMFYVHVVFLSFFSKIYNWLDTLFVVESIFQYHIYKLIYSERSTTIIQSHKLINKI